MADVRLLFTISLLACARAASPDPRLELVESEPIETSLDRPDLRVAWQVWPEMIASSRARIDIAEFYASNEAGSRLEPVVQALLAAAARGVRVRWLADAHFASIYPDLLERLSAQGVQVRKMESLHAKYFLIDGREAFVGSQNFDWRSLTHIQELGVRFRASPVLRPSGSARAPEPSASAAARALEDIFETDWSGKTARPSSEYLFDELTLIASPRGSLPSEKLWDLPALVELIDSARTSVRVQLLTYGGVTALQDALVRAAARGVQVQLLLSDWELRPKTQSELRGLDRRIEVRIFTIPQWSKGFVPFARVAHAKYCAVDAARGWVGTSNWEPDYFYKSRNVGLLLEGGALPPRLDAFFRENWTSPYAAPFDRSRDYAPPRISALITSSLPAPP
jgi:phosphatidylserine/phosphatidylglycerophosphate/cardiolipin synthase-like enzyme